MDQRLQDPAVVAPPDWRGLCEELAQIEDALSGRAVMLANQGQSMDGFSALANFRDIANRARAALSQPEPEVVGPMQLPEQSPDEHPPSNLDRREVAAWYHGHGCGWQAARAVLARWGRPAPAPAEGEVAELVQWLRMQGEAQQPGPNSLLSDRTKSELYAAGMKLTRAADLLEQRQSAPVPVASDVYFEFAVSDADYCTQAGGIAPSYAQALSEGQHYLAQCQQDGPHTLELRRVEVLPLPSREVEA